MLTHGVHPQDGKLVVAGGWLGATMPYTARFAGGGWPERLRRDSSSLRRKLQHRHASNESNAVGRIMKRLFTMSLRIGVSGPDYRTFWTQFGTHHRQPRAGTASKSGASALFIAIATRGRIPSRHSPASAAGHYRQERRNSCHRQICTSCAEKAPMSGVGPLVIESNLPNQMPIK